MRGGRPLQPQYDSPPQYPVQGVQPEVSNPNHTPPHLLADPRGPPTWDIAHLPPDQRSEFVMKVYSILSTQLLLTTMIASMFMFLVDSSWLAMHTWLNYMAATGVVVLIIGGSCIFQEQLRAFPMSSLFLALLTVLSGICIGFLSAMYSFPLVAIAAGSTAAIFFGLTMFACITRTDFTGLGPYLFAGCFGLMVIGFALLFFDWGLSQRIYGGLIAIVLACFFVYNTQLIVTGMGRSQFSSDDYAYAAVMLYLDAFALQNVIGGRT
eukprot:CAMPEP_0195070156 /NCGR_PEP_ID=MMETSP0448-20130528/14282_1 /TAXON_ID=66468 /ORGANISM="Heterocapsa triquestra, Strain CCMP 448" /LENGTH=265 /DNA_ID=CAMNT_0040101841 /DNA_START=10 /DNA_END=807 /DNA_ORIENTATION=+